MSSLFSITVSQLARLIGTPAAPKIIDLRIEEDFKANPKYLPGSYRHDYLQIDSLVEELKLHHVILVCHKGKKISQGAAQILKNAGIEAEYLRGGHVAWSESGQDLISLDKLKKSKRNNSIWVTRHRPKIDRIACPWLIKRFIDPKAQFLYVEPDEVLSVGERFNAMPFDVEGAYYNHRENKSTFEVLLEEFEFNNKPLNHLGKIVRGADFGQLRLAPESAGLLAVSLGLSRMFKDDIKQLDAGMLVYDAIYRWCRDATQEKHNLAMHKKED